MPYFMPNYEPVGEAAVFQHAFHIAEMTSGYFAIKEPAEEANNDTHAYYMNIVEEIAERNGLSGLHVFPLWPVGFIW